MKTLYIVLCLYFLGLTPNNVIGTYQIVDQDEVSFDSLELKKDGTYIYKSRGDSCWTWADIEGTWDLNEDLLTLHYEHSYEEDKTAYIESMDTEPKNYVTINVQDEFGVPISNFEINYVSTDYKQKQTKTTNQHGVVVFDKYAVIYDKNDQSRIQIKFHSKAFQINESAFVQRDSDRITITVVKAPITIQKKEKYLFVLKKGKLRSVLFPYSLKNSIYKKVSSH